MDITTALAVIAVSITALAARDEIREIKKWIKNEQKWKRLRSKKQGGKHV